MKRLLAVMTFLMSAALISATPPEVPVELKAPAGKVKEFVIKGDGNKKFGKTLVGGTAAFRGFPGDNPGETVFWLVPETDDPLWIVWVTEGDTQQVVTKVNERTVAPPPPKKPDDPPPAPTGKLYFLVIRPDGPTSTEFTKIMSNPGWTSLRTAGHSVGAATVTESIPLKLNIQAGTPLPTVVTLRVSADGRSSTKVREPVPLPSTTDAILKLPEGVN